MTKKKQPEAADGYSLPKDGSIGNLIDRLYERRASRLELEKSVEVAKKREQELHGEILAEFGQLGLSSARGVLATATRTTPRVPMLDDWVVLTRYVKRTGAFELLQRRLGQGAILERLDAGKTVPGIRIETVVKLTLTKAASTS